MNLLISGLALALFGVPATAIRDGLRRFPGVEHRMERFLSAQGVTFINDSAATIPEATLAAVEALHDTPVAQDGRILLIAGGTDKELEFDLFPRLAREVTELHLLAGTATEKAVPALISAGIPYGGPYESLEACLDSVLPRCTAGATVLFSPGCASFGMFLNEFDRGRRFKELVRSRCG